MLFMKLLFRKVAEVEMRSVDERIEHNIEMNHLKKSRCPLRTRVSARLYYAILVCTTIAIVLEICSIVWVGFMR